MENASSSFWAFASIAILVLYLHEVLFTTKLVREAIPLVGRPAIFVPKTVLNFIFATRGLEILNRSFQKVLQNQKDGRVDDILLS